MNEFWLLLFTGNIPRGVLCERMSQNILVFLLEFMRGAERRRTAKRGAGNGVNSNFWLRCEHDSQGAFYCKAFLSVL